MFIIYGNGNLASISTAPSEEVTQATKSADLSSTWHFNFPRLEVHQGDQPAQQQQMPPQTPSPPVFENSQWTVSFDGFYLTQAFQQLVYHSV